MTTLNPNTNIVTEEAAFQAFLAESKATVKRRKMVKQYSNDPISIKHIDALTAPHRVNNPLLGKTSTASFEVFYEHVEPCEATPKSNIDTTYYPESLNEMSEAVAAFLALEANTTIRETLNKENMVAPHSLYRFHLDHNPKGLVFKYETAAKEFTTMINKYRKDKTIYEQQATTQIWDLNSTTQNDGEQVDFINELNGFSVVQTNSERPYLQHIDDFEAYVEIPGYPSYVLATVDNEYTDSLIKMSPTIFHRSNNKFSYLKPTVRNGILRYKLYNPETGRQDRITLNQVCALIEKTATTDNTNEFYVDFISLENRETTLSIPAEKMDKVGISLVTTGRDGKPCILSKEEAYKMLKLYASI
jgi:hypothetical protein